MKHFLLLGTVLITGVTLLRSQNPQSPSTTATVHGRIVFTGALQVRPVNMASDPACPQGPQPNTEGLDDVMIYATPRIQSAHSVPTNRVVLDHLECQFVPHTLTMQVGQMLVLRNSDTRAHNIHAWAEINASFNLSRAGQLLETTKVFQQEEVVIPIRDDVHNWENGNVGVFSHPYHRVAKLNGTYEFVVPEGGYEIVAWHGRLGKQSQKIEIRAGETQTLDFTFK